MDDRLLISNTAAKTIITIAIPAMIKVTVVVTGGPSVVEGADDVVAVIVEVAELVWIVVDGDGVVGWVEVSVVCDVDGVPVVSVTVVGVTVVEVFTGVDGVVMVVVVADVVVSCDETV